MPERPTVLRVGLVGCGVIGRTHAEVVAALPRLELVAAIDARPESALAVAEQLESLGAPRPLIAGSLAEALAATELDLVVVATPSGLHVGAALEALDAGCHVLIEKPVDVDLPRARRLAEAADAARSRGLHAAVISQHRLDPASVAVDDAVRAGRLGRLTSAVASVPWWRSDEYYASAGWRGSWALDGGGALMNQGVHTLDLLIAVLGEPVRVTAEIARLAHHGIEVEDTAVATIVFAGGALAALHATTAAHPGGRTRLLVCGTAGTAVIEGDELVRLQLADDAPAPEPGDPAEGLPLEWARGHARQYLDLIDAIDGRRDPAVTVADAVLVLATARAVYLAAALGRGIDLADVLAGAHDEVDVAAALDRTRTPEEGTA